MDSKRSHYRIAPREGALRIALVSPSGSVRGQVLDLSIQGAGALFPVEDFPAVMPGDRVQLEFTNLLLLDPLMAEAAVRTVSEVDGQLRVGFEFTDPRSVLREVPFVLRSYFNRRRHPRVEVDPPVSASVSAPGLDVEGRLRQIGSGGAMVTVPAELAGRVAKKDRVEVRFELPGLVERFWMLAIVRGVWSDGDGLGLSLRFDRIGTVDYKRQRRAIEALVDELGAREGGETQAGGQSR